MATFSTQLQESIITLLAMNTEQGRIAASLLSEKNFDKTYRVVAERLIAYQNQYKQAPGLAHLEDVFDDILLSKAGKSTKEQTEHLRYMMKGIKTQSKTLNPKYTLRRVSEFCKVQSYKAAIQEAAQRATNGKEINLTVDLEAIFLNAVKYKVSDIDVGIKLGDPKKSLQFVTEQRDAYPLGIRQFDRINGGPEKGTLLVFLAPTGKGKSWFCTHVAKHAFNAQAKVLYITLEMEETKVAKRFFKSLFVIANKRKSYYVTTFEKDIDKQLTGFRRVKRKPPMSFDDAKLENYFYHQLNGSIGARLNNIIIKGFPSGTLTIERLTAYLDNLEMVEHFKPDVLIVDYPDLMKIDKKDYRHALGQIFVDLRGLCQERDMAGVAPTQSNRQGWKAAKLRGFHVGEDASKKMSADKFYTYSQTEAEQKLGLARIFADKLRDDEDAIEVLISQNYNTGQFVLSSTKMTTDYFDLVFKRTGSDPRKEMDALEDQSQGFFE